MGVWQRRATQGGNSPQSPVIRGFFILAWYYVATKSRRCDGCRLQGRTLDARPKPASQVWVSNFTYISTWQGWLYVAFVIDVYARRIVGWHVSKSMTKDLVFDALEQAL